MNETWYQISRYKPWISPVEVVKETAEMVTVLEKGFVSDKKTERRHNKAGKYFKTFQEAKERYIADLMREEQYNRDMHSRIVQKRKEVEMLAAPKEGQ